MTTSLTDPRFTTEHNITYAGKMFYREFGSDPLPTVYIPSSTQEVWCRPGYQPKKVDKGVKLTVNDYVVGHNLQYGGSLWPSVVHTTVPDDN